MKRTMIILGLASISLLMARCGNIFSGYGPQPHVIDDTPYQQQLNLLGILRPDSLKGESRSFVHLEMTYPPADEYEDLTIRDAQVMLVRLAGGSLSPNDTIRLEYTWPENSNGDMEYYQALFFPDPGETYQIICRRDSFPELTATTTIPQPPTILPESWTITPGQLRFTLLRDSSIFAYDLFLIIDGHEYSQRLLREEEGNLDVSMNFTESGGSQAELVIYGYDQNLTEYISYNISFKPNTYLGHLSTVENGYGCLASLNLWRQGFTIP